MKSRADLGKVLDEIGMKTTDFLTANRLNSGKKVNPELRNLLNISVSTELSYKEKNSVEKLDPKAA
jgi:hypothetical protein